jgi:PEP-CTERM motif
LCHFGAGRKRRSESLDRDSESGYRNVNICKGRIPPQRRLTFATGVILMKKFAFLAAVSVMAMLPTATQAATIVYSISGNGSGSLNGNAFSMADFSFTLTGDTANVNPVIGGGQVNSPLTTSAFSIGSLGSGTFSFATRFGQTNTGVAYFSRDSGLDLFDFTGTPVDLSNNFGPFVGTGVFALNQFQDVNTSAGLLSFDSSTDVIYSGALAAGAVPEPASWALMIAGFGLVGSALRKGNGRRRKPSVSVSYA